MDLLPAKCSSFRNPEYWRRFYSNIGTFEWYTNFSDIEAILYKVLYERSRLADFYNGASLISYEKVLETSDFYRANVDTGGISVLNIGTGNSLLPLELEKANFKSVVSIDFEESVINSMKRYETAVLKWQCIDVSASEYAAFLGEFSPNSAKILLDKAFLDAYISKYSEESDNVIRGKARSYLKTSLSILKEGDIFIIISLLQPYIAREIIRNIYNEDILVDVYPVINAVSQSEKRVKLIPYVIAMYRINNQIQDKRRCRIYGISGVPSKHITTFELLKAVNEINFNYYALNAVKEVNPGRTFIFQVDTNSDVSYSIAIYDSKDIIGDMKNSSKNLKNAVIIVPPGYEQSQLFSTTKGNEKLATDLTCDRLIMVSFNWLDSTIFQFDYQKLLEKVKSDLNLLFLKLSTTNDNIPIMTCEDDVRIKRFVARIPSLQDYAILIRDLLTPETNIFTRQLIFDSSPHTIQSELSYQLSDGNEIFLFRRPASEYHLAICMPFVANDKIIAKSNSPKGNSKIAILGSGVNVLSNLLNELLGNSNSHVRNNCRESICRESNCRESNSGVFSSCNKYHCVDIDAEVIRISARYFGNDLTNFVKLEDGVFNSEFEGNIINIHGDAVEYVRIARKYCKKSFLAVILDINNDAQGSGINSPNLNCISPEFISGVSHLLEDNGLFIANVITTSDQGNNAVTNAFKSHFKWLKVISIPEVANRIFIGSKYQLGNLIADSAQKLKNKLVVNFDFHGWKIKDC